VPALPDPDNSSLFRDIKKVGQRKVITSEPHYKVVEVEQVGEVKVSTSRVVNRRI
jgi:hypothetical protein